MKFTDLFVERPLTAEHMPLVATLEIVRASACRSLERAQR